MIDRPFGQEGVQGTLVCIDCIPGSCSIGRWSPSKLLKASVTMFHLCVPSATSLMVLRLAIENPDENQVCNPPRT